MTWTRSSLAPSSTPERLLFQSGTVRVGTFRCSTDHPEFSTAGPIEGYTIFFPRSAVWIERDDQPPFVADATIVTVYNRGQPYRRRPLAPEGDRGEWFSVDRDLALAIATGIDSDVDRSRPFAVATAPSGPGLYYRQRRLVHRIADGRSEPFEVEQEVVLLIGAVLAAGATNRRRPTQRPETEASQRELIERAKAELARGPLTAPTVRELAARVGVSPFHLCRLFRARTGMTLHEYLVDLRIRLALERFESGGSGLSRIAHELGFSSHSHLTSTVRSRLGATPSRIRAALGVAGSAPNRLTRR